MKTNIKLYVIALLALGIYFWASSTKCMKFFMTNWDNKKCPELLQLDVNTYGDLYALSYLPQFREDSAGSYVVPEKKSDEKKAGRIFILGDSYLARMYLEKSSSNLYRTEVENFFWYGFAGTQPRLVDLKKDKKNILLIEMSERFVRNRFTSPGSVKSISACYTTDPESANKKKKEGSILEWRIVPATVEQNLETILFRYRLFGGIKEAKASMHYSLYKRANPKVIVSEKQKRLYFAQTADPFDPISAFNPIADKEIERIVKNLNAISAHYHTLGFDEVVFSFIPGAASVCNPGENPYNRLLPRIQASKNLKADIIDIYTPISAAPDPCSLYWKGDTHWTVNGYLIWENEMNDYLKSKYENGAVQ